MSTEDRDKLIEAKRKSYVYGLPISLFLDDRLKTMYYKLLFSKEINEWNSL